MSRFRVGLVPVFLLSVIACGDDSANKNDTIGGDTVSSRLDVAAVSFEPELIDWRTLSLPVSVQGDRPIYTFAGVTLSVNPEVVDPLVIQGRCGFWLGNCVGEGGHGLDSCVASVPQCAVTVAADDPPCCPSACVEAYVVRRTGGVAPAQALRDVLFGEGASCIPGYADLWRN